MHNISSSELFALFFLWQLLASMIYTASCLHAAVNFPQRPTMTYVPMTPGSVYQAAPIDKVRLIGCILPGL